MALTFNGNLPSLSDHSKLGQGTIIDPSSQVDPSLNVDSADIVGRNGLEVDPSVVSSRGNGDPKQQQDFDKWLYEFMGWTFDGTSTRKNPDYVKIWNAWTASNPINKYDKEAFKRWWAKNQGSVLEDSTVADVNNNTSDSNDAVDPWTELTSEERNQLIADAIERAQTALITGDFKDALNALNNTLEYLSKYYQNNDTFDFDNKDAYNAAQNAYNVVTGYLTSQLTQMQQKQNWLFENEYNSPIMQMKRFMEAGINPVFYYGALGKSNASDINASDSSMGVSTSLQGDYVPEWQRKLGVGLGIASELGNLAFGSMNAVSAFTKSNSEANLNNTNADAISKKAPLERANLLWNTYGSMAQFANTLMNTKEREANIGQIKAQQAYTHALTHSTYQATDLGWKQFFWSQDMFDRQQKMEEYKAQLSASTSKYVADRGFQASKYSADSAVRTATMNFNLQSAQKFLEALQDDVQEVRYYELNGNGTLSGSFKTEAEVGALVASGKAEVGVDGSLSVGGKTYTQKTVTNKIFNPQRISNAQKAYQTLHNGFLRGELDPQDWIRTNANMNELIPELNKYSIGVASDAFGRYTVNSVIQNAQNGNGFTFAPSR